MQLNEIIILSSFGAAWLLMMILIVVLLTQVSSLRRRLADISGSRVLVQKATLDTNDRNHAFHNPTIAPDEELSRRGYSMYVANEVDSGRGTERQTGGQLVEELARELDYRQQRRQQQMLQSQKLQKQQHPPPFLLQSIEENRRRSRSLANSVAGKNNSRPSDTNPNFIY